MDRKSLKLAAANGTLEKLIGQEIDSLITLRFTKSEEMAIQRHKICHPEAQSDEWDEYNAYVEECKSRVKAEVARLKTELGIE